MGQEGHGSAERRQVGRLPTRPTSPPGLPAPPALPAYQPHLAYQPRLAYPPHLAYQPYPPIRVRADLPAGHLPRGRAGSRSSACARIPNLPASNQKLEGFENRIAAVMAKELGRALSYVWWGQRRGFIRNTMNATLEGGPLRRDDRRAAGLRSGPDHQAVLPIDVRLRLSQEQGLQINSLDDPILKKLRIGVHLLGDDYSNPPPVHELSKRGIVVNVVGFDTFYSEQESAEPIIDAVACGKIDVAIVWGPAVGNFVVHHRCRWRWCRSPPRKRISPFAFDISMGVRKGDEAAARAGAAGGRSEPRGDHEDTEGLRRAPAQRKGRCEMTWSRPEADTGANETGFGFRICLGCGRDAAAW